MTFLVRGQLKRVAAIATGVLAGGALLLGTAPAATAADQTIAISETQEQSIRAWMDDAGVAGAQQDVLLSNLRAGVLPLSTTRAEAPVATITDQRGAETRTIDVYSDGSRRILSEQASVPASSSPEDVMALSVDITGCSGGGAGTWQVNCRVTQSDMVSGASFVIDWRATPNAEFRDMRASQCWNSVGSCEVTSSRIIRYVNSSSGPAWAEQEFKAWIGPWQVVQATFGVRASGGVMSAYGT